MANKSDVVKRSSTSIAASHATLYIRVSFSEVNRGNIAFDPFKLFLLQKEPEIFRTFFFSKRFNGIHQKPHILVRVDNNGVQSRCYRHLQTILFFFKHDLPVTRGLN